jgi:hypothetical protein
MRGRLIPLIVCVILVGTLATVALAQVGSPSPARAAAVRTGGAFEISNSDEGRPIFVAGEIGPGGSAKGTVTIEDSGSVPVALTLKREELSDATGIGGGVLSAQLQLTVLDVSKAGSPRTIYSGPLATMPEQQAGEMRPGDSRTYEFVATLPDAAASSQNALQSASTSVAYAWIAAEGTGEGEEEELPEEPPAGEGTPKMPGGGTGTTPENRSTGTGAEGGGPDGGAIATLDLTVRRIGQTLTGGGLVTFIDCDASCRIFVRGRLRASAQGHHRTAKIRFGLDRPYTAGSKKMRIPIPHGMRNWLRRMPPPKRLKAKLTFTAIGTAGGRDVVKRKVRLRVRHHHR